MEFSEQLPRPISADEQAVIYRALETCPTGPVSEALHNSIPRLRVLRYCTCGCDTVNFRDIEDSGQRSIVADGIANTPAGKEIGLIISAKDDQLVSLEFFSYDDEPARLPTLDSIRDYGQPRSG